MNRIKNSVNPDETVHDELNNLYVRRLRRYLIGSARLINKISIAFLSHIHFTLNYQMKVNIFFLNFHR